MNLNHCCLITDTRFENAHLHLILLFTKVISRLANIAVHIWISIAFSLSPRKYFNGKFCFSCLKSLCKALHKFFRYIKQSYNLEDVRLLSYNGVRNITVFVHAIAYFTSKWIGLDLKMKLMKEKIFILSKRFFGVPSFYNYAIADGIYELLKYTRTGI